MSYIVIAPIGDNIKALFIGLKAFPTEKFILITTIKNIKKAKEVSKKLEEFTIKAEIIEIKDNILEEMFKIFGELCSVYKNEELIVNIATGDRISTCVALSAAFANGLKAFGVMENKPMLLPIMKLSYYNELSENKLKILRSLDSNKYISLQELSKKLSMSLSLLSYHINGNYKYKGLEEFRLVEVKEENNNSFAKLSELGNLLLKGYINQQSKVNT